MKGFFKQKQFINFLKSITTQGNINEGFFSIEDGICETAVVDPKNLLLVMGESIICSKDIKANFGISNIKSLINVLLASISIGDGPFEIEKNKLRIFVKGGSVKFALLDKKEIAACAYVSEKMKEGIKKEMECCLKIPFSYEVIDKLLYFCGLIENEMLTLKTIKDGTLTIGSDYNEKQSFICKIGKAKETISPLSFDCKLFVNILNTIKEDKGNAEDFAPVFLYVGTKLPIVIEKEGFLWCLAHLSTEVSKDEK